MTKNCWESLVLRGHHGSSKAFPGAPGPRAVMGLRGGGPLEAGCLTPAIPPPILVWSQRSDGVFCHPPLPRPLWAGSGTHSINTTLTNGISGLENCPAAERAGANLVLTSHQLKCFYFGRELVSHNYYWSLWQQSEKAFVYPRKSRTRNRCSVSLSQPVRASTCSKLILELTCHLKKNNDNKVLQSGSGHPNPSPVSIYGALTEVLAIQS